MLEICRALIILYYHYSLIYREEHDIRNLIDLQNVVVKYIQVKRYMVYAHMIIKSILVEL
nr:MAG TPA: hypothetical protein [Caudoviricetes sp.]